MLFVLYKNSGVPSGRALRAALAKLTKGQVQGGYLERYASLFSGRGKTAPELVVNLGTTETIVVAPKRILNSANMVRSASHKRSARQTFNQKGVPAPRLFASGYEIPADAFPVVGRTSFHSKGKGFWFCKTQAEVKRAVAAGATHFMEFVPNTREYRVHAFIKDRSENKKPEERVAEDYASIKISEKVWTGKGQPNPDEPQKNHAFGWTFLGQQNRREEELGVVRQAAKAAIAALGMDFGAVDVMYSVRNKLPYVLEVNSTPSLADENADTCERYAKRILKLAGDEAEAKQ